MTVVIAPITYYDEYTKTTLEMIIDNYTLLH